MHRAKAVIQDAIILQYNYSKILFFDLGKCNLAPFQATQNAAAKIILLACHPSLHPSTGLLLIIFSRLVRICPHTTCLLSLVISLPAPALIHP